jgi:N6-adenosine-specific RNA methylase IME4
MKFDVILADPPWPSPEKDAYSRSRKVWSYPTVLPEEILGWNIPSLSKPGTHLWLWCTQTHLPLALKCLDSWQFRYQVCITAIKPSGFGNWWAKTTQFLIFAYRSPLRMARKCQRTHFLYRPGKHSEKPEESYHLIDIVSGIEGKDRIELFARAEREGWVCIGNEVTGRDISVDIRYWSER